MLKKKEYIKEEIRFSRYFDPLPRDYCYNCEYCGENEICKLNSDLFEFCKKIAPMNYEGNYMYAVLKK